MSRAAKVSMRADAGQALAEMLVVLPLLLMLLVGVVEYGRYAYFAILVGNAARAGVQYGSQNHIAAADIPGMQNAAYADAQGVPACQSPSPSAGVTCIIANATNSCQCASNGASCWVYDTSGNLVGTNCSPPDHPINWVQVNTTGTLQLLSPNSLLKYVGFPTSFTISDQAVMRVVE